MRRPLRTARWVVAIVATATLLSTAACATGTDPTPTPAASGTTAFPVTVGSVTLAAKPTHIVSLSPTATETLFAIDAGAQVVAVDDNSTFPTTAPKTKLSAFKPNVEAIAKFQPDLVIVSNDMEKIVSQLTTLKIPTLLAPSAKTLDDTYGQIIDLGALTGHRDTAQALVTRMKDQIGKLVAGVPAAAKSKTYYYELDPTYYTVTSATFIGSLFTSVGLTNIADAKNASNPYPQLSAEAVLGANPDFIFLADTKCCGQSPDTLAKRPGWADVAAVKNNRIVTLDDDIASRWGPRVLDLVIAITDAVGKASLS